MASPQFSWHRNSYFPYFNQLLDDKNSDMFCGFSGLIIFACETINILCESDLPSQISQLKIKYFDHFACLQVSPLFQTVVYSNQYCSQIRFFFVGSARLNSAAEQDFPLTRFKFDRLDITTPLPHWTAWFDCRFSGIRAPTLETLPRGGFKYGLFYSIILNFKS